MSWSRHKYWHQLIRSRLKSNRILSKPCSSYEVLDMTSPLAKCVHGLVARKPKHLKCDLDQRCGSTRKQSLFIEFKNYFARGRSDDDTHILLNDLRDKNRLNRAHTSSLDERNGPPWNVLFFGTDQFSARILKILHEGRSTVDTPLVDKLDVVSNVGETKVRQYAVSSGLTVHDWPMPDVTGSYHLGVLASFGHLIPAKVIKMFPHGILNVHPSLLPRWRGASPIVHTILSGDQVTGVSIMKLRPKHFDIGAVLSQQEVPIPHNTTSFLLRDLLAQQGGQLLVEVLRTLPDVEEREQNEHGVTYAHKVTSAMAFVDWERQTCEDIHCQYRALGEFLPLRSEMNGRPVKLLGMQPVTWDSSQNVHPGIVVFDKKRKILCIKCMDGWVGFESIVLRKKMSAQAFYNGYLSKMAADSSLCLTSVSNSLDRDSYGERILQRR